MYKDHKYFAFSSDLSGSDGGPNIEPVQRFIDELDAGALIVSTTVVGECVHYITAKYDHSAAQGRLGAVAQAQTVEAPSHD